MKRRFYITVHRSKLDNHGYWVKMNPYIIPVNRRANTLYRRITSHDDWLEGARAEMERPRIRIDSINIEPL